MSDGTVLVGIGLGLDVLGTLFISVDAYRGQTQTTKVFDVLAYITGFEIVDSRLQPAAEEAGRLSTRAQTLAGADASDELKVLAAQLQELDAIDDMLDRSAVIAQGNNKEILKGKLEKVSDDFAARRLLIQAAIVAVFIGGICELIGGVVLA